VGSVSSGYFLDAFFPAQQIEISVKGYGGDLLGMAVDRSSPGLMSQGAIQQSSLSASRLARMPSAIGLFLCEYEINPS